MSDLSRRSFLLASSCVMAARAQSAAPPNIVFLISDDHSAEDLGCYGNESIRTPNLDRMAREGMRFENCFVTSPQCSPNRSAILTGMMAHTTGTYQPISDLEASPTWKSWVALGKAGKLKPEHRGLLDAVRPVWELYDIENDPAESYNLATTPGNRDTMLTLQQELSDWMHDTYDFLPPPFRTRGPRREGRAR